MQPITFRLAEEADLPVLIALLADDPLGKTRETPSGTTENTVPSPAYSAAFRAIAADPNNQLIVAVAAGEKQPAVVGVLQLTFIPSLTYSGGMRAQIEGVRVHKNWRSSGVGRDLLAHTIGVAKAKGCVLAQLTTDKARTDALRFYEGLGFTSSHWGLKLRLQET